jgi:sulfur carrier protein
MQITLNGERREVPEGTTVAALVEERGLRTGGCAVAVNLEFVPRTAYAQTALRAGDEVEIVTPRQGG